MPSLSSPASHRLVLSLSVIAAVSYFLWRDSALPASLELLSKGAGVGLLAVYAAVCARSSDGWLLTAGLALGALGDMVLEVSMTGGGALFALGHLVMIQLFLRNRRLDASGSQKLAAAALLVAPPSIATMLAMSDPRWAFAAGYAAIVGGMAAAAWLSRFPRYRTGLGAVLFVVSDLMIFAREGSRVSDTLAGWTIWPLYCAGQFLIATSVVRVLSKPAPTRRSA